MYSISVKQSVWFVPASAQYAVAEHMKAKGFDLVVAQAVVNVLAARLNESRGCWQTDDGEDLRVITVAELAAFEWPCATVFGDDGYLEGLEESLRFDLRCVLSLNDVGVYEYRLPVVEAL